MGEPLLRDDDAVLIRDFLEGEPDAARQIEEWARIAASPYRFRLGGDWEDTLQDVAMELTRLLRGGQFKGQASLRTYLWRVVNHTCIDRIRSQERHSRITGPYGENPPQSRQIGRPSAETKDILLRVLIKTPEECRRLWRMILEGLSYREMSRRLGVAEATLRVRVLRCRRKAIEVRKRLFGE